jgi:hypothetical protein
MTLIAWIIIGGLAGWIASKLMGPTRSRACSSTSSSASAAACSADGS